ncbi:MAG: hypothetical protein P1V51_19715 [Deltaproteobacteria bacterium]|nr:hypothetical protein [Deltaproteobacteria bacterium]
MQSVIGLSGKIRCGKTTVAENLQVSRPFRRRAFGDAIKEEVSELFGIPLSWTYSQEGKAYRIPQLPSDPWKMPRPLMTLGEILQYHGTEFRRAQDPDYWTKRMQEWAEAHPGEDIIVDDVRFLNEAKWVLSQPGGFLVRIDPYEGWQAPTERDPQHLSETALDNYPGFSLRVTPAYGGLAALAEQILEAAALARHRVA